MQTSLKAKSRDPNKYIRCYGLRNHGLMKSGRPATELIYIHSKLIIVDDRIALIGSANINDRSMMGSRDSELAVVVEDKKKVDSMMNGQPYQASQFAHDLRKRCFQTIFGFESESDVRDPLNKELWQEIEERAAVS